MGQAGGGVGSHTWGFGVDAVDTTSCAVIGSFKSPPAYWHVDTLPALGDYDIFFSYRNTEISVGLEIGIEKEQVGLSIYPNPGTNRIELLTTLEGPLLVQVFDMRGVIIRALRIADHSLDIGHVAPGLYVLSVSEPGGALQQHQMFIKE